MRNLLASLLLAFCHLPALKDYETVTNMPLQHVLVLNMSSQCTLQQILDANGHNTWCSSLV